jgi:beta-galactosidase
MKHGRLTYILILATFLLVCFKSNASRVTCSINLNGEWEMGYGRKYSRKVIVPGIHTDPAIMDPSTLWYRKTIDLPGGNWKYATLELKGARFSPEIYINGVSVSHQNGGMAPTFHLLRSRDVKPGNKIILEIALKSLKEIDESDASYIPVADQWRSNISSCLWNDVVLKLHGDWRIDRIIPFIYFDQRKADISFDIFNAGQPRDHRVRGRIEVLDDGGRILLSDEAKVTPLKNVIHLSYGDNLKPWSPEVPDLYRLRLSLIDGRDTIDQSEIPFGIKDFRVVNKQFYLNNKHITLLGGTVVWHRWMRDDEARDLGYEEVKGPRG